MFLHYLVEHNIKIEDQIWPNLGRLAKVYHIQSSGAVNLKFLIGFYTGDGSYNPIIKKLLKFFNRDVGTSPFPNWNEFYKKTLNLMPGTDSTESFENGNVLIMLWLILAEG